MWGDKPATFCWELFWGVFSEVPKRGARCDSDTCSMNDVPYFWKYHHSKIYNKSTKQIVTVKQNK